MHGEVFLHTFHPHPPLQRPAPAESWASSCLLSTVISSLPIKFHLIYFLNPGSVEQKHFVTIILPKAKLSLFTNPRPSHCISADSSNATPRLPRSLPFHPSPPSPCLLPLLLLQALCWLVAHLIHSLSLIQMLPILINTFFLFSSSIPPLSALYSPTYVSNNSIFPMSESYTPLLTFRILLVL